MAGWVVFRDLIFFLDATSNLRSDLVTPSVCLFIQLWLKTEVEKQWLNVICCLKWYKRESRDLRDDKIIYIYIPILSITLQSVEKSWELINNENYKTSLDWVGPRKVTATPMFLAAMSSSRSEWESYFKTFKTHNILSLKNYIVIRIQCLYINC